MSQTDVTNETSRDKDEPEDTEVVTEHEVELSADPEDEAEAEVEVEAEIEEDSPVIEHDGAEEVTDVAPDMADDEPTGREAEDLRVIEALLFAAASPLTERAIAERLGDDSNVSALLQRLRTLYQGRGVELARSGNRWYFRTATDLGDRLKLEKVVPRKLSRAATETLAIIAYHQPVTRAEIEEIRGVVISKGTLDILFEEGWIKPRGRRQTPGRPVTWGTSDSFLDHFGLESLSDLPGIEELKAAGLLDPRQGLAAYSSRAGDGDTLLYDTDETGDGEEPDEPLSDADEMEDAAAGETAEAEIPVPDDTEEGNRETEQPG